MPACVLSSPVQCSPGDAAPAARDGGNAGPAAQLSLGQGPRVGILLFALSPPSTRLLSLLGFQ